VRLTAPGADHRRELALLADLDAVMTDASICGLGQTAASAIRSALAKLPTSVLDRRNEDGAR
jgi:NADH-quinone oxidoreductase subunit F